MGLQLALRKRAEEIEKAVYPAHLNEAYRPVPNIKSGGMVYIIPEDRPNHVKVASWGYEDFVLEDIMEGEDPMKCVILADSVKLDEQSYSGDNKLIGIFGYCIDYGGDNYIAQPIIELDNSGKKYLHICQQQEITNFLV